jgi:hypothetical protein
MTRTITRRLATAGLAAATLAPRLARADAVALEEAARKEGTLTWYIAQVDGETAELMGRAFTAQVCANAYVTPVREDVTFKPGAVPLSQVKVLRQTTAEIAKGVPEVIEQWRDTFS